LTGEVFLKNSVAFCLSKFFQRTLCADCRKVAADPEYSADKFHGVSGDACRCESFRLNEFSPGPVLNREVLHFIVTDPQAIDQRSGKLQGYFFDNVGKSGLSALRELAKDSEFEISYGMMKENSDKRGKERFFHGVTSLRTKDVRWDRERRRMLAVYDTADARRPHHADLMAPKIHRREREKFIKALIDRAEIKLVHDFRRGAFAKYARPAA
jgi:hypothetical protein